MRHLLVIALLGFSFSAFAEQSTPAGAPPDHPHGPPPEAVAACSGKTQGAACSFKTPRGEQMSGTCAAPPPRDAGDAASLSCRPANLPPRQG